MSDPASRLCALVLALAVAAGPTLAGLGAGPTCTACPPGCAMHAHRLGCHQGRRPACHHAAGSGLCAACGHSAERNAEAVAWRAVVPFVAPGTPAVRVTWFAGTRVESVLDPFRELPTDPPRALVG